jgi:ABC-type branched-subunit amino acid transport system permease subunit
VSAIPSEAPAAAAPLRRLAALNEFWVVRGLLGSGLISILLAGLVIGVYEGTGSSLPLLSATQTVVLIFLYQLIAVLGLQVFTGNSGVVSFGHVAFMGIAAYVTALMSTDPATKQSQIPDAPGFIRHAHLAFLPSTLVAIAITVVIAIPIGFVFARLSGAAAAIVTLSWLVIVQTVIANWDTVTHGTFTFYGIPDKTDVEIWWGLGWAILAIVVARLFRESGLGLALRATSADSLVARAVGVNLLRARLAGWVLSAGMAAVGGVLYAHFITALAPGLFGFDNLTFTLLVMVIVGGRSVSGAVIGAASIAFITELLRRAENAWQKQGISTLVLAAIFLTVMIMRSEGLLGRWELDELLVRGTRALRARGGVTMTALEAEKPQKGGRAGET